MQERREFLKQLALLTGGLMLPISGFAEIRRDKWGDLLPLRRLGKSNNKVTMLGLGGNHIGWTNERDAQEVVETALEGGIRFFDTAESYGRGRAEERYGQWLVPKYRDEIYLMSKTRATNGSLAKEHLELSLSRMKCDYLDLWQVHAIETPDEVDNRFKNEVIEVFEKAKAEGKVKHLGFTGHDDPSAHAHMINRTRTNKDFTAVQMPVNVVDSHFHSFINNVMPKAVENDVGILAMKTLADGRFFNQRLKNERVVWETNDPIIPNYVSVQEAFYFVWSLPVSVLITGAENKQFLQEKIDLAKSFKALTEEERLAILDKVLIKAGNEIEFYKTV